MTVRKLWAWLEGNDDVMIVRVAGKVFACGYVRVHTFAFFVCRRYEGAGLTRTAAFPHPGGRAVAHDPGQLGGYCALRGQIGAVP